MKCEPCTYSQESEGGYLQTSFLDIDPSWQSNGSHTLAKFSENEQQKDGSPICKCGKGTFDCSIHPSTPEKWIASMQGSLAKTLALLESRQAYLREPDLVFTEKSCVLLTSFDPVTSSWKTSQQSFLTDSEPFSETWPRWGMTQDGCAYAHPMSERRITETDGLHWPTVGVRGFTNDGDLMALGKKCDSLEEMNGMAYRAAKKKKAQYWPTPTRRDYKGPNSPKGLTRKDGRSRMDQLPNAAGGQLNPTWVEWLMGFPIGFTNSKDSVMPKSRSRQQLHGNYSEVSK